jgi:hypothetical protein
MNRRADRVARLVSILAAVGTLAGCATLQMARKERELAGVAKDWCMTIRASQVMPVYPLSEDVQPGDMFLVTASIDGQAAAYKRQGFLPLDNVIARLHPGGYGAFYGERYGLTPDDPPPDAWLPPGGAPDAHRWAEAPRAAFPSYGFDVRRGVGLKLALPVQGVPIGLNLLGTSVATGSIQIADAYTYGVDIQSLTPDVLRWAACHKSLLEQYPSMWLRVVNRVYLTGRVQISLSDQRTAGGGLDAEAPKNVTLPEMADDVESSLSRLNQALATGLEDVAPGGSVLVNAASGRTISLSETFPRPFVIGYVGFDYPILASGSLGAPVSTREQLAAPRAPSTAPAAWGADASTAVIREWLQEADANVDHLRGWLGERGRANLAVTHFLNAAEFAALRAEFVAGMKLDMCRDR